VEAAASKVGDIVEFSWLPGERWICWRVEAYGNHTWLFRLGSVQGGLCLRSPISRSVYTLVESKSLEETDSLREMWQDKLYNRRRVLAKNLSDSQMHVHIMARTLARERARGTR
jgi:hypothetical protein